ncbi:MAG: HI0074 family nucleotidyltransferase substrate-binding subunit [Propionivibrio sp.]|nr:HI0074 family nucleotidyltransferase substrate-binding subunit [Propionivibrio sp.]
MGQHRERFELARTQYFQALERLHEVLELEETSIIRDSLIQRFEFTYELAWKSMFLWMKDEGEKVREMVRPVIQAAFRCELIDDPDMWEEIKDCRDETSHTYNESKAIEVAGFVRHQAVVLFDRLRDELRDL